MSRESEHGEDTLSVPASVNRPNAKAAGFILLAVVALFGGMELYGVTVVGDWSIVFPTIVFQLVAITLIVAPMIYGVVCASQHD